MRSFAYLLILMLCLVAVGISKAETVYFKAETNGALTQIERPGGSVEYLPSSGNAHAVNHPKMAIQNGYDFCAGCHRENGTAVVNTVDKFL